MRFSLLLAGAVLAASTLAARADTIEVFSLNMTAFPATVTGTVNLDFTSPLFTTANLVYVNGGTTIDFTGTVSSVGDTVSPTTMIFHFNNSPGTSLDLTVPVATVDSLSGFTGGLCTLLSPCSSFVSSVTISNSGTNVLRGTFVPAVTPTPEPPPVLLLGTALLGLAACAWARRRSRAGSALLLAPGVG